MKKVLHNIFSVFLAVMVMLSTLSFTVEKHHCMGQIVDVSFFGNAKGCEMPVSDDKDSSYEMRCCVNSVEVIESNNSELKLNSEFSLQTYQFAAIFYTTYINLFEGLQENVIRFEDYPPPVLIKDIQVLYGTFLI